MKATNFLHSLRKANRQQSHPWISGFRCEVEEICALPGFAKRIVVVPYRSFETTCRSHSQGHLQGGELRSIYYRTFKQVRKFKFQNGGFKMYTTKYKRHKQLLTISDPTSDLVRQYDFPVQLRCRKTSDTVFVAFVRPLSEPVRRFSSCSMDFSQQIAQVILFLFLQVFLF
jgi:hypothetical protein